MATKKQPSKDEVKEVIKRKNNTSKGTPFIGGDGLIVESGDNAKYLSVSMKLMEYGKVDLNNPDEVKIRLDTFFKIYADNDMKPTVAGMALALGVDRRRLWEMKTGRFTPHSKLKNLPQAVLDSVKKAYLLLEILWESYMQNGKINPVSGIFIGKNNFGYQDKTEHVLVPNQQQDDYSVDDIKKRYLIDFDDSNDSDLS